MLKSGVTSARIDLLTMGVKHGGTGGHKSQEVGVEDSNASCPSDFSKKKHSDPPKTCHFKQTVHQWTQLVAHNQAFLLRLRVRQSPSWIYIYYINNQP